MPSISTKYSISVPESRLQPQEAERESTNVAFTRTLRQADQLLNIPEYVPIGDLHNIPDSVKHNPLNNLCNWWMSNFTPNYKIEENLGINPKNARDIDICLAKYSQKVAKEMDTANTCYTGVKHALWASGVIDDYGDMPKGEAYKAKEYFDKHPERFEKLNIKASDLKSLPAGVIIVYEKEGKIGHIAITNGNGQEMSDCTDNMGWLKAEGDGAKFSAYKLTDNWKYNPDTRKLEFDKQ